VFLATGLSNAGGIGGGILLVPLLSLFAGFTLKNASANAQPLIFGASIANAMVNVPRRHAARDTPRIDWNLVACTVPFFLMGTTPGTFMNQAFPSYFTAAHSVHPGQLLFCRLVRLDLDRLAQSDRVLWVYCSIT
jgi:uncharacterized membrane protein YfcA